MNEASGHQEPFPVPYKPRTLIVLSMRMLFLFLFIVVCHSHFMFPGTELFRVEIWILGVFGVRRGTELLTSGTSDCTIAIGTWGIYGYLQSSAWLQAHHEHGRIWESC